MLRAQPGRAGASRRHSVSSALGRIVLGLCPRPWRPPRAWLAYSAALKIGPAAGVAALVRRSLAFIFLLSVLICRDPHSWRGWLGLVILLAGICLLASDR